jgi:hypothetical protein
MRNLLLTAFFGLMLFGSRAMAVPTLTCQVYGNEEQARYLVFTFVGAEDANLTPTKQIRVVDWTEVQNPDYVPTKKSWVSNTDPEPFIRTYQPVKLIPVTSVEGEMESLSFTLRFEAGGLSVKLSGENAGAFYDEPGGPEMPLVLKRCTFSNPEIAGITAGN